MNNSTENVRKIKEDILASAFKVFSEKGYTKTNLNEIAAICNTSRTPIYYHFKDKQTLHGLALNMLLEKYNKRIDEILYRDIPLEERFDDLIDFFIKHSRELYIWQEDLKNGAPKTSVAKYQKFLKLQFEKFESVIEIERVKMQEQGHLESKSIAAILYLMTNGFFITLHQNLLKINTENYRRSVKEFIRISL